MVAAELISAAKVDRDFSIWSDLVSTLLGMLLPTVVGKPGEQCIEQLERGTLSRNARVSMDRF